MRHYQTFLPRGDPTVFSSSFDQGIQSSYSGGARRDVLGFHNIQSDQPRFEVEIGSTGQHLKQNLVDRILLPSDQEAKLSVEGVVSQMEGQGFDVEKTFSIPTVRRFQFIRESQDEMVNDDINVNQEAHQSRSMNTFEPEEIQLSDHSFNAPVG